MAAAAGLEVAIRPLLHLPRQAFAPVSPPEGVEVSLASAEDDLAVLSAVAMLSFGSPGTDAGGVGVEAIADAAESIDPSTNELTRGRIARGLGAAVTSVLAADRFVRGIATVFLSAGDEAIERVYARVGCRTIGHVGGAAPSPEA